MSGYSGSRRVILNRQDAMNANKRDRGFLYTVDCKGFCQPYITSSPLFLFGCFSTL